MYVYLAHPHLPSCQDCKAWMYDIKTGSPQTRCGQMVPRPPDAITPCHDCPKLKLEDRRNDPRPEKACEITSRMKTCFSYFRLCESDTRSMIPMDLLTLEHNAICKMAEADAKETINQTLSFMPLLMVPKG